MINFSIDYLTRKDENSSEEGSPRSSPLQNSSLGNFNVPTTTATDQLIAPAKVITGPAPKDKPSHSYIALISMAILQSKDRRILLGDIYEYIMREFPYYNNQDKAWKNSIRHNLSLNECFIKNGRAENGKGNYWSIHPACIEDFSKGDFRRRQARRRARKSAMTEVTSNNFNMAYRGSLEYVPMTSSALPGTGSQFSTVPERLPTSSAPSMMPSSFMYPALLSSTSNSLPMPYETNSTGVPMINHSFLPGANYQNW